ncbi:MAG: hypothetical protein C0410_01965 [Anaerolinea sp.]|nr:hypothetical protein [Anaerolinea sp.]
MKKIIYGFVILLIICLITVTYLEHRFSDKKQTFPHTILTVKEAYLCKFDNDEWKQERKFSVNDDIFVYLKAKPNISSSEYMISINVFHDPIRYFDEPIYSESKSISFVDGYIPIKYYFEPGKYFIFAYHSRDLLFELPIEVVE